MYCRYYYNAGFELANSQTWQTVMVEMCKARTATTYFRCLDYLMQLIRRPTAHTTNESLPMTQRVGAGEEPIRSPSTQMLPSLAGKK